MKCWQVQTNVSVNKNVQCLKKLSERKVFLLFHQKYKRKYLSLLGLSEVCMYWPYNNGGPWSYKGWETDADPTLKISSRKHLKCDFFLSFKQKAEMRKHLCEANTQRMAKIIWNVPKSRWSSLYNLPTNKYGTLSAENIQYIQDFKVCHNAFWKCLVCRRWDAVFCTQMKHFIKLNFGWVVVPLKF